MKRLFPLLLALTLTLTACGGPGEASSSPGSASSPPSSSSGPQPVEIPFALAAYPSYSFHPALAENRANLTLTPLLYEPLFQVDEAFQAVPVLCQSYTASEDQLSWSFTLRPGVTFSDGSPLTGRAVADALELARQEGSRYAQRLRDVTAISASDDVISLTLGRPNSQLPLLLDIPIALGSGSRPAGTGPYTLSGPEDAPVLSARSGWWQGKELPAKEIPLHPVGRADDLISAFASGDVGLVDVDLMGTNSLGYSGNYETWDYATTDLLYLGFNAQSGLCQRPEIRRALAKAVDRDSIAQVDYARHAQATVLPVHPNSELYDPALAAGLTYDPNALVEELETLRALNKPLTLVVNQENSAKVSAAQRIAYQLESAGMRVQLTRLPFEEYTAALTRGAFDLYLGEVVLTADFDLTPLLSPDGPLNYGRWHSEQAPALLSALGQTQDRTQAAAALFAHLEQEVPLVPICFKNGSVLTQWGRLRGLNPVRGNVFSHLEGWIIQ